MRMVLHTTPPDYDTVIQRDLYIAWVFSPPALFLEKPFDIFGKAAPVARWWIVNIIIFCHNSLRT